MKRLAFLVVVAILAAGCGSAGGSGSSDNASGLAPSGSLAWVAIDTDFSSSQLQSAQKTLDKFPIKSRVLGAIRSSLSSNGVDVNALKSSIGPELDIAFLRVGDQNGAVAFTKPKDEKTFEAQLAKGSPPPVHERIGGWTAFSDKQVFLDAVKNRTGNLADDAAYQAASATWPDSAIARAYVSPAGAQSAFGMAGVGGAGQQLAGSKWLAGALTSSDGAFKLEVQSKTTAALPASGAGLAGEIPSGSIVALHLTSGGGTVPQSLRGSLGGLTKQLGFDASALLDALDGPVIAYVRAGLPIPEVTFAAKPTDPKRTTLAISQLVQRFSGGAASVVPTKVDGGTLLKADLGSIAIYFGTFGDQVVVSDSANVLAELKGSVGYLSGDSAFKDAKDAAGMPDQGQGFLFVNVKDALPAISGFAQLANQQLPQGLEANLKPLRSLLVYGARDGEIEKLVAFLQTS